ncbi:DNA topoisomerase 1 alpha [Cryptomeria japonica]|uniref:DNA topoisomerase 1 alpha n=1 Tax=Cryptomeria japonica TaxID=3369 RepID=UPI0027DAAB86|nr:DNA topoisomerase 1 alpha [Cryptomeria japonica]XP_057849060.2 DNA topoisomerase 1 alpha [Cryptomeria japonica]
MIPERSELAAEMLHTRNDETYMPKRQRIDDALDQNSRKKMDGFSNDDDDSPIVFKRNVTSKQKPTNCSQNNTSSVTSQRHGPFTSPVPKDSFHAVSSHSVQKAAVNSNKAPVSRSSPSQPSNSSSASLTASASKSPPFKHVSYSANKHANSDQRPRQKVPNDTETKSLKDSFFGSEDDSEDDKPLSRRIPVSSRGDTLNKNISSHPASNNVQSKEPVRTQYIKPENDSDDDKPLSHKFQVKQPVKTLGTSPMDSEDSEDEKPLALRCQPNGLIKKDINGRTQGAKSDMCSKKRPLDYQEGSSQKLSDSKKPKILGASTQTKVKSELNVKKESHKYSDDEDDIPIAQRMKKEPEEYSDEDDIPIAQRMKKVPDEDSDEDDIPIAQRMKNASLPRNPLPNSLLPTNKVVKDEKVFKVKEEKKVKIKDGKKFKIKAKEKKKITSSSRNSKGGKLPPGSGEGQKWTTLEHNGVIFPPPYKPHGVKMLYNGKPVDLSPEEEEVATMFAVMKDTDYATKPKFLENFWSDWKQILGKKHVIQKFELCDFTPIYEWHLGEKEKKKLMTTEEKKQLKEEKLKQEEKYMWAVVDGVKEKVGNFRVEPPGLFRGRGEHPKMGKLKTRINPEDITINIGKNASIPECPIPGHRWKEVRHDNTVTWLAFWNDPINPKEFKYVFLAASSSLKGQSDREKYEKARMLKDYIDNIRDTYTKHFKSQDRTKRQIAVATYLIDRLALRAGNEKDDDEADTVGCCTLKVENVKLLPPKSLQFDFLGKDSIRYFNTVEVDERVYIAIDHFKKGKKDGDDLFDKLDTSKLNAHLKEIMPGLTAKVFRTYNASITLDRLLQDTTGSVSPEKIADYQRANKEVAILCNHQRSVSKSHSAQMDKLSGKMTELEDLLKELEIDWSRAKKGKPPLNDAEGKPKRNLSPEVLEKKIEQTKVKIGKMELNMRIKDDLKTVALGTSKINYLDPRISVAWCKRHEVPIEKIFNKSLLAKFSWAMDVEPDYRF